MRFASAAAFVAVGLALPVSGTVLVPTFTSCIDNYELVADPSAQFNITNVFASLVPGAHAAQQKLEGGGVDVLRLNIMGTLQQQLEEYNSTTSKLATLFTTAYEAGVKQWDSRSRLCTSMFPPNVTTYTPGELYCPIPAGDFGMNVSIPLYNIHELATLQTQIHVVNCDEPARTLACINVAVTPYTDDLWPYKIFLWLPAALAIAYFVTTWSARFAAGWVVGVSRSTMAREEVRKLKWGTMIISGLSGERLGVSSALLRFVTPGLRDIIFHIQFVTMLGMININWPSWFYPIVTQSAWADLLWNVSIVSHDHLSVFPTNFTAPLEFAQQLDDPTHPLYLNVSDKGRLLDIQSTPDGMDSFAQTVGLRPRDLFGTCLAIFLMIAGGIIVIHLLLWTMHGVMELVSPDPARAARSSSRPPKGLANEDYGAHSRSSSNVKELLDANKDSSDLELNQMPVSPTIPRQPRRPPSKFHRIRKRFAFRGEAGAFHFAALYGNLLRLIITFHFPITAFSVFQLTLSGSSIVSRVFAALALAFISILIPAGIIYKISRTPTGKLYEAARTLLALGTVYNVYETERQLYRTLPLMASLIQGIVIGAGQRSGLAQTIILVVVELFCFVATTLWSPWGEGASMGAQVVLMSILRIASIIMAMILANEGSAKQWLAYAVVIVQAIIFFFFLLMIIVKILEGLIRLFGGVTFDESRHPIDGGIFAAIMDLNCFNGVRSGKAEERKRKHLEALALESNAGMEGNRSMQALWLVNRHSFSMQGSPGRRPLSMSGPNVSVDRLGRPDYSKRPSETDKSFKSTTDESGRIMDAWKPAVYGNVATLPPGEMGIKRQSWGGTTPTIRVTDEAVDARHHNRARSSSAMEELMSHSSLPSRANSASPGYDLFAYTPTAVGSSAAGSSVGGHHSQGQGQNPGLSPHGLQPPPLILRCDSAMSDDTDDAPPPRQRTTSGGWFRRAPPAISDDSDTENEGAAPSRRGWRAMFKRGHPVMDDQERGEKMARSAAALNASGAAFAGVSGTGFRVHRKTRTASSDALAAVQGSDMPLLAPPAASFRVRRPGCDSASLTPPESLPPSPVPDSPIVLSETSTVHVGPSRSTSTDVPHSPAGSAFRVVRKVSPAGSNVSTPQLVAPPAVPKPQHAEPAIDFTLGYDSDAFRPLDIDFGASPVGSNGSHSRYGHAL